MPRLRVMIAVVAAVAAASVTTVAVASVMPGEPPAGRDTVDVDVAASLGAVVSGRLLVVAQPVTAGSAPRVLTPDLNAFRQTITAASEVRDLVPGHPQRIDLDRTTFPEALRSASPGQYRIQAIMDVNHTIAYTTGAPTTGTSTAACGRSPCRRTRCRP